MYYEKYQKIRDEKKLKDRDVAVATGIDPATFSHWKKGLYTPKDDKLAKIALYLGMSLDELKGKIKAKEPNQVFRNILNLFGFK